MKENQIIFNGSIPQHYQNYLGSFLFDPFAEDLVSRIDFTKALTILELAAGTGAVTQKLLQQIPSTSHLIATDLEEEMLSVAKARISSPNVTWRAVDMTSIPYETNRFDLIVVQFGLMLVLDKLKALKEMFRVMNDGAKLIFNVWGNIDDNEIWRIGGDVIESFININPMLRDPGPFSMDRASTVQLLIDCGFKNIRVTIVDKTGSIESAMKATEGVVKGLPVFAAIREKNLKLVPKIETEMRSQLVKQLGDNPLQSKLQAFVFEAEKKA